MTKKSEMRHDAPGRLGDGALRVVGLGAGDGRDLAPTMEKTAVTMPEKMIVLPVEKNPPWAVGDC